MAYRFMCLLSFKTLQSFVILQFGSPKLKTFNLVQQGVFFNLKGDAGIGFDANKEAMVVFGFHSSMIDIPV